MSATIDERVVQMKFDNKNFEDNVKVSMGTLDKLKEALNFNNAKESVRTLNEATKSVDFSKMADSIDTISDRFSALGIVGITVLQNLTNKAIDTATEILGKVPSMIIQGGWKRAMDVEQGRFTLQGLIDDQQKVADLMEAARKSVSDTAYASNEAIKAASVFAASGIQDAEEMYYVLKGVAGVTATANADYESIARIFQTISGQGRVMGEQLNQLANRGLNAAAVMANYYDVTETEIREMVSAGEVSFEMFSEAMTETFGEHAYDANKTFTGSMANIRAALARTGEAFFKHIVAQESPAVETFNAIRVAINNMNGVLTPVLEEAAMSVNVLIQAFADFIRDVPVESLTRIFVNLFKIIGNVLSPLGDTIWAIGSAMRENFDLSIIADTLADFTDNLVNLTSTFSLSEPVIKAISTLFGGLFDVISMVGEGIFNFFKMLIDIESPVERVTDGISGFMSAIGNGLSDFVESVRQSENLKKAFEGISDAIKKFKTSVGTVFSKIGEAFSIIFKNAGNAAKTVGSFIGLLASKAVSLFLKALTKIASVLTKLNELFIIPALSWFVENLKEAASIIKKFFERIRENINIKTALEKIVRAFDRVYEATKKAFEPLQKIFEGLGTNIKKASNSFGEFVGNLAIDVFETFVGVLSMVVDFLAKIAESFVIPAIEIFVENISNAITKLKEFGEEHGFVDVLDKIKEKIDAVIEGFKNFFEGLDKGDGFIGKVSDSIKNLIDNLKKFDLKKGISSDTRLFVGSGIHGEDPIEVITEETDELGESTTLLEKIRDAFVNFGETAMNSCSNAADALKSYIDYLVDSKPEEITETITNSLNNLNESLDNTSKKFSGFGEIALKVLEGLKTVFGVLWNGIKEFFKTLDFNRAIVLVFTGLFIALTITLIKLGDGMFRFVGSLTSFFNRIRKGQVQSKIVNLASAFALVAASLAVLTLVDPKKLMNVAIIMGALSLELVILSGVMIAFAKQVSTFRIGDELFAVTASIFAIAAACLMVAGAVKMLSGVNLGEAQSAILLIAELGLVMVTLSAIMTRFIKGGGIKGFLGMIGFAAVLLVLTNAIKGIASVNFDNVSNNLEGFLVVLGSLALIAFAISGIRLTSAVGFIILLYFLQKYLPVISEIDFPDATPIINAVRKNMDLIWQLGLLAAIIVAVSGLFGRGILKFGVGVLLMSASLLVVANAIKSIGEMPAEDMERGRNAILLVLGMFAGIALAMTRNGGFEHNHALKIAAAIGAMSLCLYPIAGAIALLGMLDPSKAAQGLIAVGTIMSLFALIMWAANSGTSGMGKIGLVLTVTLAVLGLMAEMIVLTLIPWKQLLVSATSMGVVLLTFAAAISASRSKVNKGSAGNLILFLITLISIAVILWELSKQPWQNMLGASGAIAIVLLAFAGYIRILNEVSFGLKEAATAALGLLAISSILLPIGVALYLLSNQPWQGMLGASVAIGVVLLAFAGYIRILNEVSIGLKGAATAALGLLALSTILIPIGVALYLLSNQPWQGMIGAAVSMGIMILALGAASRIIGETDWTSALAGAIGCVILSLTMFEMMYPLMKLSEYPFDRLIGASVSMSILLLALTACTAILSKANVNILAAIKGALAIVAVAAILFVCFGALGALAGYLIDDGMAETISKGLDLMIMIYGKVGDAIGALLGGIVGGMGMKILEDIAIGLALFKEYAKPFFDWIGTLDQTVVDGAKNVALALIIFGASELISALLSLLSVPGILAIPAMLYSVGLGLAAFMEATKNVDVSRVKVVTEAAAALFSVKLPNSGGLLATIIGDNSLLQFNPMTLGLFGEGIAAFAEAVKNVTVEQVNGGIAVAEALFSLDPPNQGGLIVGIIGDNDYMLFTKRQLGEKGIGGGIAAFATAVSGVKVGQADGAIDVASKLFALDPPNQGGWIATYIGDNNFRKFGPNQLGEKGFGGGLLEFVKTVITIQPGQADGALDVASKLFALDPPNQGGWISMYIGDNNYKKFNAKQLGEKGFGGGLLAFVTATSGIEVGQADGALDVASKLFALDPPNQGGLISVFVGDNKFKKFNAKQLGEKGLGGGIAAFVESVRELEDSDVLKAAIAAESLGILCSIEMPKTGGMFEWLGELFTGRKDEKKFFDNMANLGKGLASFSSAVVDIDTEKTKDAIYILNKIVKLLDDIDNFDIDKVKKFTDKMKTAADIGIDKFCTALTTASSKTNEAAKKFMESASSGIENNKSIAIDKMSSFADDMLSQYTSKMSAFDAAGSNSSNSYVNGFMSNQDYANLSMEGFANGNIGALTGANGFDFTGDYSNVLGGIGENGALSLTDGLLSMQGDTNLSFENFAKGGIGALTGANGFDITGGQSNVMSGIGDTLTGSLSNSLSSSYNLGNIESSMKAVTDRINNATANGISAQNMEDHMKNFASGAGSGVDKWGYLAENAATRLADKIKARFQHDMDEHSPSRVFMEFGRYLDEGLAIGIMDSASAPVDAIGDVSSSIYDSMRDAMSNSQNYISEDLDINPVITPMVDITGAMSEIQALNSMFDDTMLALNMQARFNEMNSDGFGEIDATNSDVVSSIDGLRADLSDLKAVVGNLQVVMDSGTLVGAIVPNMDMALGQRANLKRRGV